MVGVVKSALDGRAAPNTEFVAQGLSSCYAVNVTEDNLRVVLELSAKGIPIGLHLLAVASLGRQELDEASLAGRCNSRVPIVSGKLEGGGRCTAQASQESRTAQHTPSCTPRPGISNEHTRLVGQAAMRGSDAWGARVQAASPSRSGSATSACVCA